MWQQVVAAPRILTSAFQSFFLPRIMASELFAPSTTEMTFLSITEILDKKENLIS